MGKVEIDNFKENSLGRVGVLFPWARDIYSPKSTGNTQE